MNPVFRFLRARIAQGIAALMAVVIACLATVQAESAPPVGARVALIVANANYSNPNDRLTGPLRDARTLRTTLKNLGFTVEEKEDVNLEGLKAARMRFQTLVKEAGPNAIGLFYYAGHGGALPGGADNYLIPVDVDSIATLDFERQALSLGAFLKPLRTSRADGSTIVIVVDACRTPTPPSGARGATAPERQLPTSTNLQMLAPPEPDPGFLIALSTSAGQPAWDDGRYADTLAEKLATPGLTLSQVFDEVRYAMRGSSQQLPVARPQVDKICLVSCQGTVRGDPLDRLTKASQSYARGEIGQTSALEELIGAGRTFERWEYFQGVSFRNGRRLSRLKATGANFKIADLSNSDLSEAELTGARLQAVTAVGTNFNASVLDGAYLPLAVASNAGFDKASLKRTAWLGADLRNASFRGANLRGASFRLADLREADFSDADLTNATFNGADLRGARFTHAIVSNTNFESALLRRDVLTATQQKGACETTDGYGGIQLVMIVRDPGAYGRKYLDLESSDPSIGWKSPGSPLPKCVTVSREELPDAYDSRADHSPLFSIRFSEELLEASGNKGALYDRLYQHLHKRIIDRMRAAHAMGWSLKCPFGFDFGGDCKALRDEGIPVE